MKIKKKKIAAPSSSKSSRINPVDDGFDVPDVRAAKLLQTERQRFHHAVEDQMKWGTAETQTAAADLLQAVYFILDLLPLRRPDARPAGKTKH